MVAGCGLHRRGAAVVFLAHTLQAQRLWGQEWSWYVQEKPRQPCDGANGGRRCRRDCGRCQVKHCPISDVVRTLAFGI